mmetsp:Transcript_2638/g.6061  ORF Transcript_2638/g.6061 Transcript_2638/m.6061 type:complete len:135 (-) Transcript_2638:344-748(-)|eukprot:CAMPEP_0114515198 /NCGR_PEP_ID=MMETSP0109-20121206/16595_1 /TAXON_ID=29199 /ORGANISM="Chlorarachnion reptans, Strain CCCM449" /LENGTH=134 /DNA_ID=CAMNT_0001695361 /DNA_START=37 /DNA_END=441 /DNA_ORIENTATION=+
MMRSVSLVAVLAACLLAAVIFNQSQTARIAAPMSMTRTVRSVGMRHPSVQERNRIMNCLRVCADEKATERINTAIELESPKVVTMEDLKVGEKKVYCRCWKSGTFPLCDGTHAKWNKETGDNVGPLIVAGKAEE